MPTHTAMSIKGKAKGKHPFGGGRVCVR